MFLLPYIECRSYPPGTQVETFTMAALRSHADDVRAIGQKLLNPRLPRPEDGETTKAEIGIEPCASALLFSRNGSSGAIRRLRVAIEAEDISQALRSTIIQISFDGEPCVWCPVGEFFGTGYDVFPHTTWLTRVHEVGWMQCQWPMPFANGVEIRLSNLGGQRVDVRSEIDCGEWRWDNRSMRFHATWRQATAFQSDEHVDYNYVTVQGKGVYVGDSLTVFCSRPPLWDSTWWGEGDEKIYVDGETFPSHFGTGTEDYYGYAWCRPNFFEMPWHAQPCGRGNKRGGLSVNCRYRLLDAIPFKSALRFDMEIWLPFKDKGQSVNFAPTTFFYAMPGAVVGVKPDPETARLPAVMTQEQFSRQTA